MTAPKLIPTDDQIARACLSYRADFNSLEAVEQSQVKYAGLEWLLAWQNAMPEMGNAQAAVAAAEKRGRDQGLEEAARIAETEGVYPELNIWNGGPEWYRHAKRIAAALRTMKEE